MHAPTGFLLASLLTPATFPQTALLREGDPSPTGAATTVTGFGGHVAVNRSGGYAIAFSESPTTFFDQTAIWGSFDDGPGALLRETSAIGNLAQETIDPEFGMSESGLCYQARVEINGGPFVRQSVWIDDTPIAVGGDPAVDPLTNWFSFDAVGSTQDGLATFRGGTFDGANEEYGTYVGLTVPPLYVSGVQYPNLPLPLSTASFRVGVSALGTNSISSVTMEGSVSRRFAMMTNGEGLILGGTLVRQQNVVPASVGGNGERWGNFSESAVNEAGDYFFDCSLRDASVFTSAVVRNGVIVRREGDIIDGLTFVFPFSSSLNEIGQLASIVRTTTPMGDTVDVVLFEDRVVLREGDLVDWDGDGTLDPDARVESLGLSGIGLSPSGTIFVAPRCEVAGELRGALLRIDPQGFGQNYCDANPNSTGSIGRMSAEGSAVAAENDLMLRASELPASATTFFITSQAQGFTVNPAGSQGNLCVLGSIGRYVGPGQVQTSSMNGSASLILDLTQTPQPTTIVAIQAGETWNFQAWHRDVVGGATTSNFTDGLAITFE